MALAMKMLTEELAQVGWHLREVLGRSPTSVVYRAERDGVAYAVKVMREGQDPESALRAYRREAAMLISVGHPSLPMIHEVGQAGAWPYMAMELLEGRSLTDALTTGPLDVAATVGLGLQVARGLAAAHRAGLVHRDMKPDNLMFDGSGKARIIDFGLAGATTADARGEGERDAEVVGTLRYSAPEQSGMLKRPVDHRSDLYGLGVVLFECLVGAPPFTQDDVGELLRAHAVTVPPRVGQLRDDVPALLELAVAKLLAKDPDDRYVSADALVGDLVQLEGEEPAGGIKGATASGFAPMVGRRSELAALVGVWNQVTAGSGGAVVVTGAPGTGKSRLVCEVIERAARDVAEPDRPVVLVGRSSSGEPTPFAAFRAAIDNHLQGLEGMGEAGRAGLEIVRSAAAVGGEAVAALSPRLARIMGTSGEGAADDQIQFASAVAEFLAELGRRSGGLVLWLDDTHWMDAASRLLTTRLAAVVGTAPVLLICTGRDDSGRDDSGRDDSGRDDGGNASAVGGLRADLGPSVRADVSLGPFSDAEVADLIANRLGGPVPAEVADRLGSLSRGNPFALTEYLRTLVDNGLVSPHWGRVDIDLAGLNRLDLPTDVFDLIESQLDRLGADRHVLVTAAVIGARFDLPTLARIAGVTPERAFDAVSEALGLRLIEPARGDEYRFVHDRVQQLLLDPLDEAALRRAHQVVAEALDPTGDLAGLDRPGLYGLARHYERGEVARAARRAYEVCWAAGSAAHAENAVAEAVGFLEAAAAAASTGGFEPDPRFLAETGAAYAAAGRLEDATQRLTRALDTEPDLLRRSYVLDELARVQYARPHYGAALDYGYRALGELGLNLPRTRARAWLACVWGLLRLLGSLIPLVGFGTARGQSRERHLALMRHGETTGRCALQIEPTSVVMALSLRVVHSANRVGPSPEFVQSNLVLCGLAAWLGMRRVADWTANRSARVAEQLGDPRLQARVEAMRGFAAEFLGQPLAAYRHLCRAVDTYGRWLPTGIYVELCMGITVLLDQRGYSRRSEVYRRRAIERGLPEPTFLYSPVVLDDARTVQKQLDRLNGVIAAGEHIAPAVSSSLWGAFLGCGMNIHVERGQYGPELDRMIEEYHRYGPTLRTVQGFFKRPWQIEAYGRLGQARTASPADRPASLARATRAIADLGRLTARSPVLRGHYLVCRAELDIVKGRPERAEKRLSDAERIADRHDAPWIRFEAAVVRARVLQAMDKPASATVQARMALAVAECEGWVHRAARVRRDLLVDDVLTPSVVSSGAIGTSLSSRRSVELTGTGTVGELHDRRHLEALMQVSAAASSVLDPRELSRTVLDELLKILGAERAFLFQCPAADGPLEQFAGRDSDGNDIDELAGYSTTVVERARSEGRTMVVTGTDKGEAVGSHSAVAHGLRSIMVAPLTLDGRVRGVIYLDSRIAKGIFAAEDERILSTIAGMLASSLETARAAQLELTVQAERQQRGMADALRDASAQLSRILVPDEVLAHTLRLVADTVHARAGVVLVRTEDDELRVARVHTAAGPGDPVAALDLPRLPASSSFASLADPLVPATGARLPEVLHTLLDRPTRWFAVPLVARDELRGVLVMTVDPDEDGVDAKAGIAAAFAGHAVIAYDNAKLFREVEQLATTDGLTGLFNRRYFMEAAGRELTAAQQNRQPLAAIMLDIDHFKKVNDTYGHHAGDDVIQTVAARLAACIRHEDLLGRYGGEEFVLIIRDDQQGAVNLAERLRVAVESSSVPTVAGDLKITVSVGVSMTVGSDAVADSVLARADASLYQAKRGGRNQVALADAVS